MKAVRVFGLSLCALAVFSLPPLSKAGDPSRHGTDAGDTATLQLAVTLADGSVVIGSPAGLEFRLITEFAGLDIDLALIESIELRAGREFLTVAFANGDRLTGAAGFDSLHLQTLFGEVAIELVHIVRIIVRTSELRAGLMLHYTFDHDGDDGKVIDQSGGNRHGKLVGDVRYVGSPAGRAIRTVSKDTYVICNDPGTGVNGRSALTVAARFQLLGYSTYGALMGRGKSGADTRAFDISVGGVNAGKPYPGTFSVRLGPDRLVTLAHVQRFAELGRWHHVAGVFDGYSLNFYADGELIASRDVPDDLRGKPLWDDQTNDLVIGKSSFRRTWSDAHIDGLIDEVMVFDRALSFAEIRRLAESPF